MGPRVMALPALAAALALALGTSNLALAAALAAVALGLALIGPRWQLDLGRQLVTSIIGAGVGYVAVSLLYERVPGYLTEGWVRLAACALLAGAARFVQPSPRGGAMGTVLLLFLSVLVAGENRPPGAARHQLAGPYAWSVLLFLGASLVALRSADPARPRATRGAVAVGAAVVVVAGVLGAGSVAGLRQLHDWLTRKAATSYSSWHARTGFSDQMELGALDGMIDSDTVVMRVRGPRVDYLRGAAFDVYEVGRWRRSDALSAEVETTWDSEPATEGIVEVQAISSGVERFFLPLGFRGSVLVPTIVKVDPFGVIKRTVRGDPLSARFALGDRDRAPVVGPSTHDFYLPRRVRTKLTPLVADWTAGASTPEAKIDAIERKLGGYQYSRTFRRDRDLDPALSFLLYEPSGHCEYFATGMALMARAAHIPARVVTGYRVAERTPLGDYYLVRERNAHAWVEVWVDGKGWITRDPTPADGTPQNQPHETGRASAVFDLLRIRYDEFTDWLGRRTLIQITSGITLGLLALGWLVARGVQKRRQQAAPALPDELALPFLQALLDALASGGLRHDPSEPLALLAARVADPDAAALLLRYEALRYGGQGDAAALASDMQRCAQRLRAAARSG